MYVKEGSGQMLGATLVARHAGEMLSELTLAITAGLGLGTIARTIHHTQPRRSVSRGRRTPSTEPVLDTGGKESVREMARLAPLNS